MSTNRYRVTFNGFHVVSETWDDALDIDGQHDEVYLVCVNKKSRRDGTIVYGGAGSTFVSATLGDISSPSTLGPRVKAGTARQPWYMGGQEVGGLISGDDMPSIAPWTPPRADQLAGNAPPCRVWEDDLAEDEVVHLAPALWEWDIASPLSGWLQWQVETDAQFGERAKQVFGPISGAYGWVFDAVSLGIQTVGGLEGLFRPAGRPGSRPIGVTRDPAKSDAGLFNPMIIELTQNSAEALLRANPANAGLGVLSIPYQDDPYLRGHYVLYMQVHRVS
ncbi:hypothetical protein [Actinomycetospora flava]|uniref:Minor tail protein n=1 Tax=Actinomycetospora flava TaxID=3129232 RepID=A0ABU8M5F2_9PSEU